jgi:amino-acid N-acetyltransferase
MDAEPQFSVRAARQEDVDRLVRFLQTFVQQEFILERTPAEIESLMHNGFVAEAQGRLIGCAGVEIYSRKLAEIQALAVDENYRYQGVGRALVEACVALARAKGVRELMAITATDGLFQKCGFHYALPGQKRALFVQLDEATD